MSFELGRQYLIGRMASHIGDPLSVLAPLNFDGAFKEMGGKSSTEREGSASFVEDVWWRMSCVGKFNSTSEAVCRIQGLCPAVSMRPKSR